MAQAYENDKERPDAAPIGNADDIDTKPVANAELGAPPIPPDAIEVDPLPPGCPPPDATDGPKRLFRLAAGLEPAASDFRTAYERGAYRDENPCQRRSLSCYSDVADADALRRRVRHFKTHHICEGVVPAGEGLHLATPSRNEKSHCSWWPSPGIVREQFFKVVP